MNSRFARATSLRFSLPVLTCLTLASGACAVPAGDAATTPLPEEAALSADAGGDPGATSGASHHKPRDFGPVDIVNDVKTLYNDYTAISGVLNPAPNTTAEILADLSTLASQMQALDAQVQELDTQITNLAYQDAQAAWLANVGQIQEYEAQALTASQELALWQQTGGSNAALLAEADTNSQVAANTLMSSAFYYRPTSVANAPNVFDARPALLSYLFALSVRLAVVSVEHPNFRSIAAYDAELQKHVTWLEQIANLSTTDISCPVDSMSSSSYGFDVCSVCEDTNSGYQSTVAGLELNGPGSACSSSFPPSNFESNVSQYVAFYDRWDVAEELGVHVIQAMAAAVQRDAINPLFAITKVGSTYDSLGPLVSGAGKCLTAPGAALPTLTTCSQGSATQIWQTGNPTITAPLTLATPPAAWSWVSGYCVEAELWVPNWLDDNACSGALAEEFVVTSSNQLQWAPDQTYCLTDPGTGNPVLEQCNGSAAQQWTRSWPIPFLPVLGHK